MSGFEDKALCKWLEDAVRMIMERNAVSIVLVAQLKDGEILTAYKNAGAAKKTELASHIQVDAMMDVIEANREERGDTD